MVEIKLCGQDNYDSVLSYLKAVDNDFETPLSQKVHLEEYANKLLKEGFIVAAFINNRMVGLGAFYANDLVNFNGYLSVLSVSTEARGMGIARKIVNYMLQKCRQQQMAHVYCDSVNPIAISLYLSLGFTIYKKVENKAYLSLTFD